MSTPVSNGMYVTVAEIAGLLRVSKMTVYRLIHAGELKGVTVGRSIRVHRGVLRDYLNTLHEQGAS